jgi:peroxiredoxin
VATSAETHRRQTATGKAPPLDLADVDGNPVSFDDLSGHKRILVTWASWCGCRHELAGWQRVQDELADAGLRLFSVALDHDPEQSRPWIEAGRPSYPVAVDTAHVTAERYAITNVPSVVWVDEDDNIVKPPTIAPGDDQFLAFTRIESEQHHEALRRWVREGILPAGAGAQGHERTDAEQQALAERRVAAYLQRHGDAEAARRHLAAAQELAPWDWTVRRGGIAMTGGDPFLGEEFTSFWEEWDACGRPGYTPTT